MIPPSGTSSGRPGAAGCHRLSPRCPCSHHQPFGELLIFFPQSFTVDQFWPATLSHGCYPGTAWCDGAGLLHPSLEPGGHPQTQLDFSKSKYFAPSPGSRRCGLVPPTLSPSFCLRRGGDTRLGLCHRPPLPQHFALPLQDPKNTSEEILAWMSSGQGKARGWLCLLHPILCPSPKSLSPSMVLPTGTRPPLLQNQVV